MRLDRKLLSIKVFVIENCDNISETERVIIGDVMWVVGHIFNAIKGEGCLWEEICREINTAEKKLMRLSPAKFIAVSIPYNGVRTSFLLI